MMDPWKALTPVLDPSKEEKPEKPIEVNVSVEPTRYKGEPIVLFEAQALNALSDKAADISLFNAVHVDVIATGTTPSATISLEGSSAAGGIYIALPDPNSSKAAVTANTSFDVLVGSVFVRARVASISGTFGVGQGFTVVITPFIAASGSKVAIDQSTDGTTNAVHLLAGTALAGKFGIDQTTPGNTNRVDIGAALPTGSNVIGSVVMSSVTAAKLQKDKQAVTSITCTLGDTDYAAGATIPVGTKYILVWGAALFKISVDEATSATIGPAVAANTPGLFPVTFGAVGGDSKVHAQSSSAGTVVYIAYLQD